MVEERSPSGGHIAGTLVRARLHFIEQKFGRIAVAEANRQIAPHLTATGGNLLFRHRYPSAISSTLESVVDRLSPRKPVWRAMGAFEARLLLGVGGPYSNQFKTEGVEIPQVTAALGGLLSLIYGEIQISVRHTSDRTCVISIRRSSITEAGAEIHAGFLVEALDLAGATQVLADLRTEPSRFQVHLQWVARQGLGRAAAGGVSVRDESAIAECRERLRKVSTMMGIAHRDLVAMAVCVSELARNIVNYAGSGTVFILDGEKDGKRCLRIRAEDHGPGIPHIDQVLAGQYRSKTGLGMGLLGVKRLADEFSVLAPAGGGTTVELVKYVRR